MALRTLAAMADLIEDRVDRDRADTTFDTFVQDMINLTLQEIHSHVPWARWLLDEVALTATVNGTQYIVAPSDMDFDSMVYIRDETTNRRVRRINPQEAEEIDPGRDLTGDEILWWYQRVETASSGSGGATMENRIYFLYRPDSADTLRAIFGINSVTITSSQTGNFPEKYEWIIMEGALSKVWERIDPENAVARQLSLSNFQRGLEIIKRDANNTPGEASHLYGRRPTKESIGVKGASWPANFDIG